MAGVSQLGLLALILIRMLSALLFLQLIVLPGLSQAAEPAASGIPALNSTSKPRSKTSTKTVYQKGPAGPPGRDGISGMSIVTGSENTVLASGATGTVFAHCPDNSVVSGCSVYSSHPLGVPYRVFPRDKDSCEASFVNIAGGEQSFEFRVIAHCILTTK